MKIILKIFVIGLTLLIWQNTSFAQTNVDDLRQAAKIFYVANDAKQSQAKILEIPENQRTPNDYMILGNAQLDTGDKAGAIASYNNALKLDKTFYQAYYNLGNLYSQDYKYDNAINFYKSAIKYKKTFSYTHYNLGCAYLGMGEFSLAKKSFEKAILSKVDEPDFYYNLAYAYKKLDNPKKAQKSIDLYNQLIKTRLDN